MNNNNGFGLRRRIGHIVTVIALLITCGYAASDDATCPADAQGTARYVISQADVTAWSAPVPTALFGASGVYHSDDDAFWQSPGTPTLLREAGISALRFPGGELAENYDWATHRVLRPDDFPREAANDAAREARTDFREFLAAAKRSGISQITFVVNLDSAFRDPGEPDANILRYARHAAAWVKAVRDAGYFVPYWEVGNESSGAGYPLSAREYARALNVYAREMRAADPRILIGANGPGGKVNFGEGVALADKLGPATLAELRAGKGAITKMACAGETVAVCTDRLRHGRPAPDARTEWWSVILAEAADSFDFVVIHRYDRANLAGAYKKGRFPLTDRVTELREALVASKGKHVPVLLTEWNTPNETRRTRIASFEHVQEIAMQSGMNAAAGIDAAFLWPMRVSGEAYKPLFTPDNKPQPVARLFQMLAPQMVGARVSQASPTATLYALQMRRGEQDSVLLVNTGTEKVRIDWQHSGNASHQVDTMTPGVGNTINLRSCAAAKSGRNILALALPAKSIVIVRSTP